MSFDVYLEDENGHPVSVDRHSEGGTYVVGGTYEATLNITYNYSWFYFNILDKEKGLRWLNEMVAKRTLRRLEAAVKILGTHKNENYWLDTPGNAGYALNILLGWAKQHPEGKWSVS